MQKTFLVILILALCLITPSVKAGEDDTNLYCEYSDTLDGSSPKYYMIIEFTSTNIDNFDYYFKTIPDDIDAPSGIQLNNKNDLINSGMLNENTGLLQCPALAVRSSGSDNGSLVLNRNALYGDIDLYISAQSCPKNDCYYFNDSNNQIIEKPVFSCFYLSENSDKKIDIGREQEGGPVYITYPDGSKEVTSYPITEACQDFYFNTATKKIKWATYEYLGTISQMQNYDPTMYDFICGSSSAGNKNVEYFCEEGCDYPNNANIDCGDVSSTINKGNINLEEMCNMEGVKNTLKFLGYLLLIIKILVPIFLIVLGVIDFTKAIISSDNDSIQKSTNSLIVRIIAGVSIFLIPTIVNFIFKGIINHNANYFNDCRTCIFEPNKCVTSGSTETSNSSGSSDSSNSSESNQGTQSIIKPSQQKPNELIK